MPRRHIVPPTRFPNATAASYARAMSEMVRQMHSITYAAFQQSITTEAKAYKSDSLRLDGPLDVIIAALQAAKSKSDAFVFTAAAVLKVAQDFVNRTNYFNRKNIADQVQRVKGIDPTANEPWLADFMRASVAENVAYITNIPEDYYRRVTGIVLQGVKNGQGTKEMAKEISKAAEVSYNRAKFIALDQAGSITGQLTAKRHQAAGVRRFKWSTSHDERVRTEHRGYDGKVYDYNSPPAGKLPGVPYRCRCVAYPVFNDEEESVSQEGQGKKNVEEQKVHEHGWDTVPELKADLWARTKHTGNEHGAIVANDSGDPIKILLEGGKNVIQNRLLLDRMEKGKKYTHIHTHPGGTSFSYQDLYLMLSTPQITEIVVLSDKMEYALSMVPGKVEPSTGVAEQAYRLAFMDHFKKLIKKYGDYEKIPKKYKVPATQELWQSLAPSLGLEYTETKR